MDPKVALYKSLKAFLETVRAIAAEDRDPHDSTRGEISPDGIKYYNKLAKKFNQLCEEPKMMVFREDTAPNLVTHPKALEVLMQLKIAVETMEEDLHRNIEEISNSKCDVVETRGKKMPKLFIGSSMEGLNIAKIIQLKLKDKVNSVIWHQGIFGLSHGILETLMERCKEFDYAIFILTPDDVVIRRDTKKLTARDNVIFELGLFIRAIGRDKVFIVCHRKVELPTDLAGITVAYFSDERGDIEAILGPVCTKLEIAMGFYNNALH